MLKLNRENPHCRLQPFHHHLELVYAVALSASMALKVGPELVHVLPQLAQQIRPVRLPAAR